MHPLANHLAQLQELTLIRDEQQSAKRDHHLERLNESIRQMTAELPRDVRQTFVKLQKRNPIAIAPISDGNCSVCGMKLPISLVQLVRQAEELHSCPNCARILYAPQSAPRRVGQKTRRTAPRKVGIARFSSESLMVPRLAATDKEEAIRELAYKMESEGFVDNADLLTEDALRREAIVSTAIEKGLAFPHVRGVEGGGLTLALGVSEKGIDFNAEDGSPTHVIFFIVIPTAASAFYLKLLAGLSRTFSSEKNRNAVMAETDPGKLWKTLVKVTRTKVQ